LKLQLDIKKDVILAKEDKGLGLCSEEEERVKDTANLNMNKTKI
jgi:hypothetical protein